MIGTILLHGLSEKFEVSPRHSGYDRAVLEVYPSASLWAWGLPHRGVDVGATLGRSRTLSTSMFAKTNAGSYSGRGIASTPWSRP